jgi:membrane fusion protein
MLPDSQPADPARILNKIGLFRAEAIEHARGGRFGTIVLQYPRDLRLAIATMVVVTVFAVCLVGSFEYTSKVEVDGVLLPRQGLVRIPAPKRGQVLYASVSEGDRVKAGQVLFAIRGDSLTDEGSDTSAVVTRSLAERKSSALQERQEIQRRADESSRETTAKVAQLAQQAAQVESAIALQSDSLVSAKASADRVHKLFSSRYVSQLDVSHQDDLVLQASLRLDDLRRTQSSLRQQVISERALQDDRLRQSRSELAKIAGDLASLEAEEAQTSFDQRQLIRSPVAGTISGITVSAGQTVDEKKVLASIEPNGSELIAELYATSKAIGLVKPGQKAWLRVEAFPYQTYGQAEGIVESISRSAMQNDDFVNTGFNSLPTTLTSQPVYRVRVRLKRQKLPSGSSSYVLRSGMSVQSILPVRSRRLYQLVVDPLREIGEGL